MHEPWIPIRFVAADQTCHACFGTIPRGAPGARVGERGTRAWMLKGACVFNTRGERLLGPTLYSCLACHDELTRADLAEGVVHMVPSGESGAGAVRRPWNVNRWDQREEG